MAEGDKSGVSGTRGSQCDHSARGRECTMVLPDRRACQEGLQGTVWMSLSFPASDLGDSLLSG